MIHLEDSHFWFRGRREILQACLNRYLTQSARQLILDAGCGTGANLAMLKQFGEVYGVELNPAACCHAAKKTSGRLLQGKLESLPFQDGCFNLVTLLDVLEHIDNQQGVLSEISRVLSRNGVLLVTVPAFRHLWGGHDISHHHRRRYRARELRGELEQAGMQILYISYFNTLLYPLVAASRFLARFRGIKHASDMQLLPAWMNYSLYQLFRTERLWVGHHAAPFGVSLVAVARKH